MFESGAVNREEIVERETHLQGGGIFFEERSVEHGGIVGGDGDGDAVTEKSGKRMMRQPGMGGTQLYAECVGAEIAGGADFERDLAVGESVHQSGAANGGDAVADTLCAEEIDRILDLFGAASFSGVGDEV